MTTPHDNVSYPRLTNIGFIYTIGSLVPYRESGAITDGFGTTRVRKGASVPFEEGWNRLVVRFAILFFLLKLLLAHCLPQLAGKDNAVNPHP